MRKEGCGWGGSRCGCGCGCSNHWWNCEESRNARLRQAFREGYEAGSRDGSQGGCCSCRCSMTGIVPLTENATSTTDCGCRIGQ